MYAPAAASGPSSRLKSMKSGSRHTNGTPCRGGRRPASAPDQVPANMFARWPPPLRPPKRLPPLAAVPSRAEPLSPIWKGAEASIEVASCPAPSPWLMMLALRTSSIANARRSLCCACAARTRSTVRLRGPSHSNSDAVQRGAVHRRPSALNCCADDVQSASLVERRRATAPLPSLTAGGPISWESSARALHHGST